jgi:hypothetical protein
MSRQEWTHRVKIFVSESPDGAYMIEAGLHFIEGNNRPHFSLTAWSSKEQWGGACHERILTERPDLAPIAALHLSDNDGVPMHAVANARYHAGIGRYGERNAERLARHLRCSLETANELIAASASGGDPITSYCEMAMPRWKAEADAAIALLDSLAS